MRKTWALIITMTVLPLLMVACAPNRLFESFYPQYKNEESCGFVQNVYGERISWNARVPIRLRVHESFPQEYMSALESAIDQWDVAVGRRIFELDRRVLTGPLSPRQDGENVIYWLSDWEESRPSEQARTTVYWVGDQISEADIRVNAKNFSFYVEVPQNASDVHLPSLLIHELGHVLGLKHNDGGASVMATYLASNTIRDEVGGVDSTDLRCEY